MSEPANANGGNGTENGDAPASGEVAAQAEPIVAEVEAPAAPKDPLADAKAEIAKLRDQLLRTAADFDNYRKRTRRDVDDAHRKGGEELLRTLLPVFDNLERAAVHADQGADAKAIGDGVRMVIKQFTDTLGRVGIKRIAAVGLPFDPLVHEAIQQVETADVAAGTVVAEVAPGYLIGERLVRAAMVVVAKPVSKTEPDAKPSE